VVAKNRVHECVFHSPQDLEEFYAFEGKRIKMKLKKCYKTDTEQSVKVSRKNSPCRLQSWEGLNFKILIVVAIAMTRL
jgi:hypothetical protein